MTLAREPEAMQASTPIWAGLTPEEHEFQYNPQKAFPDFADARTARAPLNERALARLTGRVEVRFGEHPLRTLDIYPAEGAGPAPVHIFFHGGYWRAQDKANFAYIAPMLVAHGITAVIANYELCPASTLDGAVDSALAAIAWVHRHIAAHGGDPMAISLSGHSAGGHLVAEALATDWHARGLDPACIIGAVAVSGIYDPTPAMRTSVNADIRLTAEIAHRHNVEQRPPLVRCPVSLFVGGREPWQWIDQTYRYAEHLHCHGIIAEVHVLPPFGHFDITAGLADPAAAIGAAMLRVSRPR
jgi:arylformamidase